MADGNCLFRALSYVLTGSEDDHMAIRVAILNHLNMKLILYSCYY